MATLLAGSYEIGRYTYNKSSFHQSAKAKDPLGSLAALVSAKIEEGDFIGTFHLASVEDSIVDIMVPPSWPYARNTAHPDSNIPMSYSLSVA